MLVIGGNIAKANKYFLHVLKDKIKEKVLKTQIIISEETDKSALCGAAYYGHSESSQQSAVSNQQSASYSAIKTYEILQKNWQKKRL